MGNSRTRGLGMSWRKRLIGDDEEREICEKADVGSKESVGRLMLSKKKRLMNLSTVYLTRISNENMTQLISLDDRQR